MSPLIAGSASRLVLMFIFVVPELLLVQPEEQLLDETRYPV